MTAEEENRLRIMARPTLTWDLSPNDHAAIAAALAEIDQLRLSRDKLLQVGKAWLQSIGTQVMGEAHCDLVGTIEAELDPNAEPQGWTRVVANMREEIDRLRAENAKLNTRRCIVCHVPITEHLYFCPSPSCRLAHLDSIRMGAT